MTEVDITQLAVDRRPAAGSEKPRRSWLSRYVLPGLLVLGFLALTGWAARDMVFPPQDVTVMPVHSSDSEVRQEGTPLFQAAGWIEPRPTPIRVAALAPGVVESLLVVEDQEVRQNEPVAEMVKDDAKLAHDRAKADFKLREAERDEAKAALAAARIRLDQPVHLEAPHSEAVAALARISTQLTDLPFRIRQADADFDAAQRDYESKQASAGVVKAVDIDIARSAAEAAKAAVEELRQREHSLTTEREALRARAKALQTRLSLLADEKRDHDEAQAKVKAATARVEQAGVALAEARLRLDRMTIRAPVDGRVYHLLGHPGSRVGSGMTQMQGHDGSSIITMYQPDKLQVRVDVRFEDLPNVHLKQPVAIRNPAITDPIIGKVLFISSEADIQKNTLQVKVSIPNPPPLFRPEMLVDVTFREPASRQAAMKTTSAVRIYIPSELIVQHDSGPHVWVADQSRGRAVRQQIEVGRPGRGNLVEVTAGLTVASRLIVSGRENLQPDDRIRVRDEAPPVPSGANSSGAGSTHNHLMKHDGSD